MKRILSMLLGTGILLSLLSGCRVSPSESDLPVWDAGSLTVHISDYAPFESEESGSDSSTETVLFSNDPKAAALYADAYGLSEDQWEDFATFRGTGLYAYEITVFRMVDEDAAVDGEAILKDYLAHREGDFFGYAPSQAELVRGGQVVRADRYLAVLVCEDAAAAAQAFTTYVKTGPEGTPSFSPLPTESADIADSSFPVPESGSMPSPTPVPGPSHIPDPTPVPPPTSTPDFSGRFPYTPPEDEDMTIYDTSAILSAWENGDPSSLSPYDKAIYDAAESLLAELITDGMSDLEKETALFTWITNHITYDWRHTSLVGETAREAYTPYGGLVNHSAVCLGYSMTFQLLCDMSGVECITVVGAAEDSTASHAWNMVRLDDRWYCVDVTWDANGREQMGRFYQYRYFNISSDEMSKTHQWDYLNVPEAE